MGQTSRLWWSQEVPGRRQPELGLSKWVAEEKNFRGRGLDLCSCEEVYFSPQDFLEDVNASPPSTQRARGGLTYLGARAVSRAFPWLRATQKFPGCSA